MRMMKKRFYFNLESGKEREKFSLQIEKVKSYFCKLHRSAKINNLTQKNILFDNYYSSSLTRYLFIYLYIFLSCYLFIFVLSNL